MGARVLLTPQARRDLRKLPAGLLPRIQSLFERLAEWPEVSGVKWLGEDWQGHARLRTGDWRVIFRVQESHVVIVRVRHRKRVYE